ncbi:MAG: outer membrane beta-barrel protein, partial [Deltaproteobacteria bacterium]|nr:outer membrane beta-barrel protein [Deltaproteobacteria bacterium]
TTLNKKLELLARYGLRFEQYEGALVRNDELMRGSFGATYHVSDWASLGTSVWWQGRYSTDNLVEYEDVGVLVSATLQY